MANRSYADLKRGYANLWRACGLDKPRVAEIDRQIKKIAENIGRYRSVEDETGVPWFWIACVHYRESSLNFAGVLHNGQKIIGKNTKTTIEPKGRGPFHSWEAAAIDALTVKPHRLDRIDDWPASRCLYEFERYNGWGYMGRENSPYVWAGTTLSDETGKFTRDHYYDPNAVEKQLGCAAIMMRLVEVNEEVAERLGSGVPLGPSSVPGGDVAPVAPGLNNFDKDDLIAALLSKPNVTSVLIDYAAPRD